MKIKIGGSATMKTMLYQYEPIEVSTTMEFEKDFENDEDAKKWFEDKKNILNKIIENDIEDKIKSLAKRQKHLKEKLKEIV